MTYTNVQANLCQSSFFFFLLINITQTLSAISTRHIDCTPRDSCITVACACDVHACERERCVYGLIENDSSAKRMRVQQSEENASCASAGRNSESDQTLSDFPTLFFLSSRTRMRARGRLSPIQSMAFSAENNEVMRRDMKFSVTPAIRESLVDSISETSEIIDSDYT